MGLEAAGAYLEELRKRRGYSRARLGAAVGVVDDIILRIEKGRGETAGSVLLKMVDLLGGSYDQVLQLLNDPGEITADDARAIARAWITRPAVLGDRELTAEEEGAELFEIALRRTNGDREAARRLLVRALNQAFVD